MAAAQAAARRAVEAIERQARERSEAGLPLEGLPNLSVEGERDGFYQAQLIRELAVRHITGWTGVELKGGPAPPTPENIAAVIELYPVGDRFFQGRVAPGRVLPTGRRHCHQPRSPEPVGEYHNRRGPAEQWIEEGKHALRYTRLPCHGVSDRVCAIGALPIASERRILSVGSRQMGKPG